LIGLTWTYRVEIALDFVDFMMPHRLPIETPADPAPGWSMPRPMIGTTTGEVFTTDDP
jgi:hypothetical protein